MRAETEAGRSRAPRKRRARGFVQTEDGYSSSRIQSKETSCDTVTTTVYRGHATARPRAHHTTKLHPLHCDFARFYNTSPDKLGLEAIRQYEIYMLQERKLSPETVNSFVSSAPFLYLHTLGMPWTSECFPRITVRKAAGGAEPGRDPAVPGLRRHPALPGGSDDGIWRGATCLRSGSAEDLRHRFQTNGDPRRTGQRTERSLRHAVPPPADGIARLGAHVSVTRLVIPGPHCRPAYGYGLAAAGLPPGR